MPILFRDSVATLQASQHLLANGFYVPPIIQVGVPKDQPRLRFFLSAAHTEAEIRGVIACLAGLADVEPLDLDAILAAASRPAMAESAMIAGHVDGFAEQVGAAS